ncbi:oxygenase MpaB family protein [Mycolicibacter minnesotensis]
MTSEPLTETVRIDTDADPDVLTVDTPMGRNVFYAGTRLPERGADGSLGPRQRAQHPVPPNSLLWKYALDLFVMAATGQRIAIIENMWPQLGQGVSDHSLILSSSDYKVLSERGKNSVKAIAGVLYAPPEQARKYGVQLRNFHKPVKGDMPGGHKYHAINAETWYFTHCTFFELIYRADALGVLERPLTRAEKEQIFEESKEWYSLFGVDDRCQPETYAEFEKYWQHVLDHELTDSKLAQYTVGLAYPGSVAKLLQRTAPPPVRALARPIGAVLGGVLRMITVGPLEPQFRDKLHLQWSTREERRFRRYVATLRRTRMFLTRINAPLKFRYPPAAAAAFAREGIDPASITLESAREALRAAREQRSAAEQLIPQFDPTTVVVPPLDAVCVKCARTLETCDECDGSGTVAGDPCDVCHGTQRGCPVHHDEWHVPA